MIDINDCALQALLSDYFTDPLGVVDVFAYDWDSIQRLAVKHGLGQKVLPVDLLGFAL